MKVKIKIPKGLVTSKLGRNCENKQDIEGGFGNIDYVFIGGNRHKGIPSRRITCTKIGLLSYSKLQKKLKDKAGVAGGIKWRFYCSQP